MIKLNNYITEAWSGVKKQSLKADIESWCDEMGIKKYTINSKGEIDVDGNVNLSEIEFEKLPYKFGIVTGYFDIGYNKKLISLENCPDKVGKYFVCNRCIKLDSLEGCPKKVGGGFHCANCKIKFTKEEVRSLCKVNDTISI